MTPEEKAAAKAPLLEKRKAIEAKIAALKQQIADLIAMPKEDTQGSEVGSPELIDNSVELQAELEAAEDELLANATEVNKYAGRRRRRRGGAESEAIQRLRELKRNLPRLIQQFRRGETPALNVLHAIKAGTKDIPLPPAGAPPPPGFIPAWVNERADKIIEKIEQDPIYNPTIGVEGLMTSLEDVFARWPDQGGRRKSRRPRRKARKTRRS